MVGLGACDLRAAEAAGNFNANALGAEARSALHRALHGAAEGDAALELLGDVLGHQLRVGLRLAHFDDVQRHVAVGHRRDVLAQLVDIRALLADDHAGARGIDGHAALLVRALDDDARDAGLVQTLFEHLAHADVVMQQPGVVVLAGEPARIPGSVDAEAQPDRIDLLTHYAASPSSRTTMVISENGFSIRDARPRARAENRFITRFLPTKASATTRASMSRLWLFSALEIAELSALRTSLAIRRWLNSSSF